MQHRRLVQLVTIVMLLAGLQGFAADMRKGPYLIYPNNPEKMTVLIQANDSATTYSIRWGTTTDYSSGSSDLEVVGDDYQYRKTITGLTPNTRYLYEVDLDGTKHTGTFRSAPAVDATSVVIYSTGDTRSRPADMNEIITAMVDDIDEDVAKRESVWIHCGDWNGKDKEHYWDAEFFNREYQGSLAAMRRIPIMGCRGNHEDGALVFKKYWSYTHILEKTTVPVPPADKTYYSFDYGPVHMAVVDDNIDNSPGSAQYNWLLSDLQASTKPWTMMLWHKPAYTAGGHGDHGSMQEMVKALQTAGVTIDVVMCGHSHFYARVEVDGVVHLTTGGGGADKDKQPKSPSGRIKASYKGLSFARMEVDGSNLFCEVENETGKVVDTFRLAKGPKLTYDPLRFVEAMANDGSIKNTALITLHDSIFAADVTSGGYVTANNVPNGLTASFVRDSDTQVTILLTGNAAQHAEDGIRNLQVVFSDNAFNGATAADIAFTTQDFSFNFDNPKIITAGEDWRYMKGTSEPPSDWNTVAFDDSAWLIGPTPIGYERDNATELSDMEGNYSTVFMRREFTINNPGSVTKTEFHVRYDDGFAAYINGTLIASRNVPSTITHKSLTLKKDSGSTTFDITAKASAVLKKGVNLLSVVLLNESIGSNDATVRPELSIGGDSKPTVK